MSSNPGAPCSAANEASVWASACGPRCGRPASRSANPRAGERPPWCGGRGSAACRAALSSYETAMFERGAAAAQESAGIMEIMISPAGAQGVLEFFQR